MPAMMQEAETAGQAQNQHSSDHCLRLLSPLLTEPVAGLQCWQASRPFRVSENLHDDTEYSERRDLTTLVALSGLSW